MEELNDQTEVQETEPKKVKKGFTLSSDTIELLEAKAKEVKQSQSKIVDAVVKFGIRVYGENGMADLTIMTLSEIEVVRQGMTATSVADEPALPTPEPPPTKRGRREKLRVPGMTGLPQQVVDVAQQQKEMQSPHPQQGQDLYRPNLGQGPAKIEQPQHTAMMGEQGTGLSEANMNYIVQQLFAMTILSQQQGTMQSQVPQNQQPPVDMNPYNQPEVPQPAPQFAASYPPGYTGAPGVGPGPQQPAPEQPMYPYPPNQPRQQQPSYQNDPYAMNMAQGSQGGQQGQLTAQGLLSGNQFAAPNVAQPNVNMDIANRALGPNWRQNLRRITAQNARDN